jgi:branched-chain amino acid transport system permease protein
VAAGRPVRAPRVRLDQTTVERLVLLVAIVALALMPFVATKFYLQLFAKIMIMAIFAMSLDLLVGYTGLVSFGHAAFYGLGAYTLYLLSPDTAGASLFLSLPVAMGVAAVGALLIGLLVLRSSGVYFIMVTLAFSQMFFYYVHGSKALGGSDGVYINVRPDPSIGGWKPFDLALFDQFYYVVLVLMVLTYLVLRVLLDSLFGRALVGIKSNEGRMRSLGYATFRYKLAAFVAAGALAGLAGYLDAAQFGFVNPDLFGWRLSGEVLMVVILGGMGTLYGPVLGAFAFVLLQEWLSEETKHWLLPMGIFIMAAVLVLPHGIARLLRRGEARDG